MEDILRIKAAMVIYGLEKSLGKYALKKKSLLMSQQLLMKY